MGSQGGASQKKKGTRENVMHNRLDLCQNTKLMMVWGRGVAMEHGWPRFGEVYSG